MRQEVGWSATAVVAIAAAIGISARVGGRSAGEPQSPKLAPQSARANQTKTDAFAQGPCVDMEERLQSFLGSGDSIAAPESCYAPIGRPADFAANAKALQAKAADLTFVIATVPDPLHTHFPLSFDRLMESIQQGATDENYVYDSSWLPWETEEDKYALIADQEKADDEKKAREDQPGIVLYRKIPPAGSTDAFAPFRDGLVVFVVGEEPTHGLHRQQFVNAAAWMAALQPKRCPAGFCFPDRIIGPSFSGSLPSLATALLYLNCKSSPESAATPAIAGKGGAGSSSADTNPCEAADEHSAAAADGKKPAAGTSAAKTAPTALIYSGSVTSGTLVNRFLSFTAPKVDAHLWSFQQSDDRALDLYCRYLRRSGFEMDRLAIVSEDETAYGNEFREEKGRNPPCFFKDPHTEKESSPARLFYPRDISALRTAYQKQSIFYQQPDSSTPETTRRTLTPDIADPEGEQHDTIRNYSGDQVALSQEAVLQQIVSQLRVHQSEYILLRSSSPLDQLFLSHYLRLAYPQGRIVILGADLLLRRESGATRLSGIMTLSTYPQLPWEPHWTRARGDTVSHSHRVFPHDGTEGTYVATRFLLHSPSLDDTLHSIDNTRFLPVTSNPDFRIPDYAAPFWIREQGKAGDKAEPPPTWLSVLGRNDFWPVAALDDNSLPNDIGKPERTAAVRFADGVRSLWDATRALFRTVFAPFTARTAHNDLWRPWAEMPLSIRIAWMLVLIWALFHFVCCASPSVMKKPSHRAYFAAFDPYRAGHRILVVLGSLAIACTATVLGWGCGAMSPEGQPLMYPRLAVTMVPIVWILAALALAANIRREDVSARWRPALIAFASSVLGFYYLLYFSTENSLLLANRMPTYWRDMNLTSGVSPLIPLLAPAIGIYLWFWYSLQGLALLGPDRPVLPPSCSLRLPMPGQPPRDWLKMFSHEWIGSPVEKQCMPFAGATLGLGIVLLLGLLPFAELVAGGVPIRGLGSSSYNTLVCILVDICVSIMLANAWRLLRVWMRLNELLTFLNRLRLRRSMAAFSGISWGSVWKISGNVLDMRYKLLTRQSECATHLENALNELKDDPHSKTYPQVEAELASLKDARKNFAQWYTANWDVASARDSDNLFFSFQECLARSAGVLLTTMLIPAWSEEDGPDPPEKPAGDDAGDKNGCDLTAIADLDPHIRLAEKLVCYVYLGFIQNILGRLRSIAVSILWLFVAVTVAMASYPFDPRPAISAVTIILFFLLGAVIVSVYAQMHRDPILSYVTNTRPGELGIDFWIKLVGFGAGPALGLIATVFPELTDFLFSWVQPGISSFK